MLFMNVLPVCGILCSGFTMKCHVSIQNDTHSNGILLVYIVYVLLLMGI